VLDFKLFLLFLTKYVKTVNIKMDTFGEKIRKLREGLDLPLRKVSAFLDMDQAILSKIERGQRTAQREQVVKLALYFNTSKNDLLTSWLADKLLKEIGNEEMGMQAINQAENKLKNR
jgi:HTH-type transcriptional regulator, competence development regulator